MGSQENLTEVPEKQAVFQISLLSVVEDSKLTAQGDVFVKEKPSYRSQ
jgi:hypothetical protein